MMRSKILDLLRSAPQGYISGEDIAGKLRVSRTAVWKHIRELKQAGYSIESHSRKGYALIEAPDLLLPNEIKHKLTSRVLGCEINYYDEVDSTNNQAKLLAAKGAAEGAIVISEAQSGGRGRLSRGWVAPYAKGVWLSVILRPDFLPQDAPKCTLMAAVAVVKAVEKATGIKAGIKWPNDILYEGKKFVGILTEMNAEMDKINYVVIGMGINVNFAPEDFTEDVRTTAVSLSMIKGEKVSRLALLCEVLQQLEDAYRTAREKGFAQILESWRQYSVTLGQEVNVIGHKETFAGVAVDIDETGALQVKANDKIRTVLAGDVSIRAKV